MSARGTRPVAAGPRWGLVLGGGGVLGGAWMVGALSALEEVTGRDVRKADVMVGTSVGSFAAALLGAGASVEDWRAHQLGYEVEDGPMAGLLWDYDVDSGAASPPTPGRRPGSPRLLTGNARHLRRLPPATVVSALLPEGRGSLDRIGRTVDELVAPQAWVDRPGIRIIALDYGTGRRTTFTGPGEAGGAEDSDRAQLGEAVMASCAIPGWYAPVTIGGRRYVDGGTWSSTNVDLVAADGLDEVVVLAPMVALAPDRPRSFTQIVDRQWRAAVTGRCLKEVARLHDAGTQVTVLGPGPEDLAAMGSNLMDPRRRMKVLETSMRTSLAALADPGPLYLDGAS